MPKYFQTNSYIVDRCCMDICIVDNNGNFVRPWLTVAINPVCRRIMSCRISLKPLEK